MNGNYSIYNYKEKEKTNKQNKEILMDDKFMVTNKHYYTFTLNNYYKVVNNKV